MANTAFGYTSTEVSELQAETKDQRSELIMSLDGLLSIASELSSNKEAVAKYESELKILSKRIDDVSSSVDNFPSLLEEIITRRTSEHRDLLEGRWALIASRKIERAASNSARLAINDVKLDLQKTARKTFDNYHIAAESARKAAWSSFGGLWAWMFSVLLVGIALGLLIAMYFMAFNGAIDFGRDVEYFCEKAGGKIHTATNMKQYCIFWFD